MSPRSSNPSTRTVCKGANRTALCGRHAEHITTRSRASNNNYTCYDFDRNVFRGCHKLVNRCVSEPDPWSPNPPSFAVGLFDRVGSAPIHSSKKWFWPPEKHRIAAATHQTANHHCNCVLMCGNQLLRGCQTKSKPVSAWQRQKGKKKNTAQTRICGPGSWQSKAFFRLKH